jgi:chaperone required for assembly of F1-ATPase
MKRFWDEARATPLPEGFAVQLDGRPVRLPGGASLLVPREALAHALAEEWQAAGGAKGGDFELQDLPLTRLVGTAIERVAPDPAPMVEGLARYAETDLLCYRAEDARLAARQVAEWQPWLDWAALALDAPLRVTSGIVAVAQPPDALAALRRAFAAEPPLVLAALGVAVPALGSAVLGLAMAAGALEPERAHEVASLDERFQREAWGEDAEATAMLAARAADVALAARAIALARG